MIWIVLGLAAVATVMLIAWGNNSGGWRKSSSGNPMRVVGNMRITVFPSDEGWKYCIAELPEDDDPYFSDVYQGEDQAMQSALDHVAGRDSAHQSNREIRKVKRDQTTLSMADNLVAKEFEKLDKAEASVVRALSGATKASAVENLKKSLVTRARASSHLYTQLIDAGYTNEQSLEKLSAAADRYFDLRRQIGELG